jgi:hypothetical protein
MLLLGGRLAGDQPPADQLGGQPVGVGDRGQGFRRGEHLLVPSTADDCRHIVGARHECLAQRGTGGVRSHAPVIGPGAEWLKHAVSTGRYVDGLVGARSLQRRCRARRRASHLRSLRSSARQSRPNCSIRFGWQLRLLGSIHPIAGKVLAHGLLACRDGTGRDSRSRDHGGRPT